MQQQIITPSRRIIRPKSRRVDLAPMALGYLMATPLAAAPSWSPATILAARQLFWMRADLGVDTGAETWTDQTNGNVFTTTTITQDSSGLNGKKRIVFPNSASNFLTCNVTGTGALTKGQLFCVGKWAGGTASLWNFGAGSAGFLSFSGDVYENGLSTARQGPFAHGLSAGDAFAYEVKADASGNVDYRINGASIGSITGNTVGWQMFGISFIGGNGVGTFMNGEVEEVWALNDNLTGPEHASYAAYALAQWGVTF